MATPTYARADQLLTIVFVDGENLGAFATKSGGEVTADVTKIRPAALSGEVSLGGPSTVGDLTVGRHYQPFRDDPLIQRLSSKVGSARVVASVVALDGQGQVFKPDGNPYWVGVLSGVNAPDADAGSGDAAMLELTVACDGRG